MGIFYKQEYKVSHKCRRFCKIVLKITKDHMELPFDSKFRNQILKIRNQIPTLLREDYTHALVAAEIKF